MDKGLLYEVKESVSVLAFMFHTIHLTKYQWLYATNDDVESDIQSFEERAQTGLEYSSQDGLPQAARVPSASEPE